MNKMLMTAIKTSISEVMETMFFLPVEFGPDATLAQCGMEQKTLACQLAFAGDFFGHLILVVPKTLAAQMAENFMGESRDLFTDEHLSGTMAELLNMVCGNALSRIDSKIPFELGIPEVIAGSEILATNFFTRVDTLESKMAIRLQVNG